MALTEGTVGREGTVPHDCPTQGISLPTRETGTCGVEQCTGPDHKSSLPQLEGVVLLQRKECRDAVVCLTSLVFKID